MKDKIEIIITVILLLGILILVGYDVFIHNDFCQIMF